MHSASKKEKFREILASTKLKLTNCIEAKASKWEPLEAIHALKKK